MFKAKNTGIIVGSLLLIGLISAAIPAVSEAQNPVNVKVVNGATTPVPVRDMDNARQPVQVYKTISMNGGSGGSALLFAVPAGKRLVIETVTVRAELEISDSPAFAELLTNTTDPNPGIAADAITTVYHEILVAKQGLDLNGNAVFVGTHQIRLYSEPNTFVFFQFGRSGGVSEASALVSISGYTVDVQ